MTFLTRKYYLLDMETLQKIAKVCKSMGMKIYKVSRKQNNNSKYSFNLNNLNKAVKDKDFVINLLLTQGNCRYF